ncbi:MAG: LLM class flavin-dependent oxidoreductase [bacterium]|nr:LLM class flavin-dependent oxidoreductase [bacterium]
MFTCRFELRVPPFADVTHAQLHREHLDMVSWCDDNGIATVIVSEHHGADDGFMCSPLVLASAALARTDNIMVAISALLLPFHDPIRIAEDIATIDLMAPGRLSVTMGVGYREFEFDMFDKDRTRRGRDTEEAIELILRCWRGEPFEHEGRTIWVTPEECAQLERDKGSAMLHPLVGGIDPAIGWESLDLTKNRVMPLLAADG